MNCMGSLVKYILYLFNFIFVVCGILLIILGSIMVSDIGDITSFKNAMNTIPILIIVLGCIIFIIAFFGCCGAIRENNCCLMTYSAFMFILIVLQLALIIWMFVWKTDFLDSMSDVVQDAFNQNDLNNGVPMNVLQINFKCCGIQGYQDYTNSGLSVPNSCCGSTNANCPASEYTTKRGCRGAYMDFWDNNIDIIRYAGIGVLVVELVALIFACCLGASARRGGGNNA